MLVPTKKNHVFFNAPLYLVVPNMKPVGQILGSINSVKLLHFGFVVTQSHIVPHVTQYC